MRDHVRALLEATATHASVRVDDAALPILAATLADWPLLARIVRAGDEPAMAPPHD